jgi:cystine transport system substrate-binding protein
LRVPVRIDARVTLGLVALVGLLALALLARPATGEADSVGRLRAARSALAAREQAALLQLYSLNTSLDRARTRVARVDAALAAARRDREAARLRYRVAQRSLRIAETRLGAQLRALYERDSPDVLAVVFGATSLDEIITGLDGLNRTTASTSTVVEQTRRARREVEHVLGSLNRKAARLAALRAAAAAQADELGRAQAERTSYIDGLRTREQLTARRIAVLQTKARAAEAASTVVTVRAQAAASISSPGSTRPESPPPAPAPPPPPPAAQTSLQPAAGSGRQLTVVATAYSLHGGTASGLPTGPGVVAVDPTVIPLGTRMEIPGYGPGIAADTGSAIKGLRIDLWFPTLEQTYEWGRRTVTITLR